MEEYEVLKALIEALQKEANEQDLLDVRECAR